MLQRIPYILFLFCFCVLTAGCSVLLSEQEWSENYALLDGTQATSLQMIDGDMNTVGVTNPSNRSNSRIGSNSSPEVVITLPEKKVIRRIVIHTDNIKKYNLYADKGGSALSDSDWHLIKEEKSVRSTQGKIVIPVLYSFPTDKVRLVVLGTSDDAALTRKENASGRSGISQLQQTGST